ncbi:MAG: YajQ family cyclic di-GMP-binding protein [Hyphomicrobiales bacterium]|nr:YajQ family cyclic di-GMP-binding protein [Rickettsiales bacterium]MCP5361860.1 YajQ family cyclic di-GMP-binding protein [Hyphomicrobiales bacterium]
MPSFDVVCQTDLQEVENAVQGVMREVGQRYDFKGSKTTLERNEKTLTLLADDDYKLGAVQDMLKVHITRRKLDPRCLIFGKEEKAGGNMLRQEITVRDGLESDVAKKIAKIIKESKMKVQAAIRGEEVRITGNKRDDLQKAIQILREEKSLDLPLQFINFRD